MKALIISDSHGKNMNLDKVIKKTAPVDLIIHLGDLEGAEAYLEDIAPCPVEMVCGNNDFFTPCEKEKIIEFGKYRIFMCHGHQYSVSFGNERIKNVAMALWLRCGAVRTHPLSGDRLFHAGNYCGESRQHCLSASGEPETFICSDGN